LGEDDERVAELVEVNPGQSMGAEAIIREFHTVRLDNLVQTVSLNGGITYTDVVHVSFPYRGVIDPPLVENGDFVREGDILGYLFVNENDLIAVTQALEQLEIDLRNAQDNYTNQLTVHEQNLRAQIDRNAGFTNHFDKEIGMLQVERLQRELDFFRASGTEWIDDIRERIEENRRRLEGVPIIAPRDGYIWNVVRMRLEGETAVSSGSDFGRIFDPTKYYKQVDMVTRFVRIGNSISVTIRGERYDAVITASKPITSVAVTALASDITTVTFEITDPAFARDFPDLLDSQESLSVEFTVFELNNIIVIPDTYIRRVGERSYVNVYEDGAIKRRYIVTGLHVQERVQVLQGLEVGMVISR
jgi:multidrug efflux pump subunit AcrA (membrane-fusion protein)